MTDQKEVRGMIQYYDIGLNLFCRQFPDPEKIVRDAMDQGVCCILTGTDPKENEKIDKFVRTHDAYGTAGIHPHNADRAMQEDFARIERIVSENEKIVAVGECGLDYDRMFSTNISFSLKSWASLCFCMSAVPRRILSKGSRNTRISAKNL